MAAAILRQLDECELLSLQGVSPSRFATINKLSMGGARAITRRAHLIVPQNATYSSCAATLPTSLPCVARLAAPGTRREAKPHLRLATRHHLPQAL